MASFQTVIYFLASFGLTYLLRHTNGIFDIFLQFRILLGKRYDLIYSDNDGFCDVPPRDLILIGRVELPTYEDDPWYSKLVDCFWCLGTWVSGVLQLLFCWMNSVQFDPFSWLASVGVLGIIYTILQNGEHNES